MSTATKTRSYRERDGYKITITSDGNGEYSVQQCLGKKKVMFCLYRPSDTLNSHQREFLRSAGKDPRDFFSSGGAIVRNGAREIFDAAWSDRQSVMRETRDAEQRQLAANVPGLIELRAAREAELEYELAFERMMEDGYNDGVNPPSQPTISAADIADRYPRAAVYLRAEQYSLAEHWAKSKSGDEAQAILAEGGKINVAESRLSNWLDDNNITVD